MVACANWVSCASPHLCLVLFSFRVCQISSWPTFRQMRRYSSLSYFRQASPPMTLLTSLLVGCGVFTVILGACHLVFPERFGFFAAIPKDGPNLPPFRLGFYAYDMNRSDLRGIVYVMNHCVSYALI